MPRQTPTLNTVVRLIAQRGGFLGRKHDSEIKGTSVTPALSSSTGKTAAGVETKENSFRLRLNYAF